MLQPGYRPQVWQYRWDSRNQLRVVDTPNGERWLYRYDPFGRRVGKRCDQKAEEIRYLWDGDQIAEIRHYRHGQLVARRHWVYNGWELVVQQRQHTGGDWETDFVDQQPERRTAGTVRTGRRTALAGTESHAVGTSADRKIGKSGPRPGLRRAAP